jgi:hypothetical protein
MTPLRTNNKNIFMKIKEQLTFMEIYQTKLEEDETLYFKRELYDKLDAIRKKIALRTISKFLLLYVNMKFESRRKEQKPKKNITNKIKK